VAAGVHADVAYYLDSPLEPGKPKQGKHLGETVPMLRRKGKHCSLLPRRSLNNFNYYSPLTQPAGSFFRFEIQPSVSQVDHRLSEQEVEQIFSGQLRDSQGV